VRKQNGFTLIEVVVAMAILGITFTALFGLFSASVQNLRRIEDLHRYQIGAEEVMNRVLLLPVLPAAGRASGQLRHVDGDWLVRVEPWIPQDFDGSPGEAVVKIIVEVVFAGRSERRTVRLETIKPVKLSYENLNFSRAINDVFPSSVGI